MVTPDVLVGGFTPFSTIDFPDRLSAIVFLQGCLWRCPYCHNKHLQSCKLANASLTWQDVIAFLNKRKNKIDGVVFSGGEPLLQPSIRNAIAEVKELGFAVAVHTGGGNHEALSDTIAMIDWVGLDIKAPDYLYEKITGGFGKFANVEKSLNILLQSGIDFEVRTTVYPKYLGAKEVFDIAEYISKKGVTKYVLQEYRADSNNNENIEQFPNVLKDKDFLKKMSNLFKDFSIRNA